MLTSGHSVLTNALTCAFTSVDGRQQYQAAQAPLLGSRPRSTWNTVHPYSSAAGLGVGLGVGSHELRAQATDLQGKAYAPTMPVIGVDAPAPVRIQESPPVAGRRGLVERPVLSRSPNCFFISGLR